MDYLSPEARAKVDRIERAQAYAEGRMVPPRCSAYVGCPRCGYVTTVLLDPGESPPWCLHNDAYSWRPPDATTQAGSFPWTLMIRVEVVRDA